MRDYIFYQTRRLANRIPELIFIAGLLALWGSLP